jgi:hypothetical protein
MSPQKQIAFANVGATPRCQILGERAERQERNPPQTESDMRRWTMTQTQVNWWASEVERGPEDVSRSPRSGRPANIGIDEILAHRLEHDPHVTVRK